MDDLMCPECDSFDIKILAAINRCNDCGCYFEDDDMTVSWERSSRNRTHAERDYDDHEHDDDE